MRVRLGVAFEGGGVRCAAGLGVLCALEKAGLEPYAYAGCGAGAAVAATGACGLAPQACLARLRRCVRAGRVREGALRTALEDLFSFAMYGRGRLAVPALDLETGAPRVYASMFPVRPDPRPWSRKERLCNALLAAMAVPGVATPVEIGGRPLCGGGMLRALLPQLLLALGAERVLCVRAAGAEEKSAERGKNAQAVRAAALFSPAPQRADWTISVENKCASVGVLDAHGADALFEAGYEAAQAMLPLLRAKRPAPQGMIISFPGGQLREDG